MCRRLLTTDVAKIEVAKRQRHNLVTHRDVVSFTGPGSNSEFCDRQFRRAATPSNCQRRCPGWSSITFRPWSRLQHGAGDGRGLNPGQAECLAHRSYRVSNSDHWRWLAAADPECNATDITANLGTTPPASHDHRLCQGWVGRLVRPDRRRLSPV